MFVWIYSPHKDNNNISFGCRTYVDSLLFRTISMHGRTERILYGNEFRIIYTSLRRQIRCCALATTMTWFYELIDRQLAAETVAQAQRRIVRRKLVNTNARS